MLGSVKKIIAPWSDDHPLDQSIDHLYGPLRELTIRNENEAYCDGIVPDQVRTLRQVGTSSNMACAMQELTQ